MTERSVREQVEEAIARWSVASAEYQKAVYDPTADEEHAQSRLSDARYGAFIVFNEHAKLFAASEETAAELTKVKAENERLRKAIRDSVEFGANETTISDELRLVSIVDSLRAALQENQG